MGLEVLAGMGEAFATRYARLALAGTMPKHATLHVFKDAKGKDKLYDLQLMFNPATISYSKTTKWVTEAMVSDKAGAKFYQGGSPADFTLDLLYDTTDVLENVYDKYVYWVEKLLWPVDDAKVNSLPPTIEFKWGDFKFGGHSSRFLFVATKVNVSYEMFLADGTPVRATCKLTLEQYDADALKDKSSQNPTSVSYARKLRRVGPGETLDQIAFQEYGNPAHWRYIADTNGLLNPMDLKPGTVLKLVPLP